MRKTFLLMTRTINILACCSLFFEKQNKFVKNAIIISIIIIIGHKKNQSIFSEDQLGALNIKFVISEVIEMSHVCA